MTNKVNYTGKYMKYFISKINDVEFNLVHNNANSVQRSHLQVMMHVIFPLLTGK